MDNRNINYKEIGLKIRTKRKAKGLTQTELAALLGKSLRTVQKYESGEIEISLTVLNEIANILDCELTFLIASNTLAEKVLEWWEEHQFDTKGPYDDINVYSYPPDCVIEAYYILGREDEL